MKPQITAGNITGTAPHLLDKLLFSGTDRCFGANAVVIRFYPSGDYAQPMILNAPFTS